MRWPKTTFGQMGLFIASILLINFISSGLLVRTFMVAPGAKYLASTIAGQVITVRTLLKNDQTQHIERFYQNDTLTLHKQKPVSEEQHTHLFFIKELKNQLQQQLGDQSSIVISDTQPELLWIKVNDSSPYWLSLPLSMVNANGPILISAILLLLGILSLAGGFVVARKISHPIKAIAKASLQFGKGMTPNTLHPEGPEEIQQMSAAFNQMVTDVQQLGQDRELMLAGISHDLRTPITRIRLAMEMMQGNDKLLSGMLLDVDEMEAIINQFIQYSQSFADEPSEQINLQQLIEPTIQRYQTLGHTITTECPNETAYLKPNAMKLVINNLLDNAIQYGQPPFHIEVQTLPEKLRFIFTDHGEGIGNLNPEMLFKPFTRKDKARSSQGSGLCLAKVKRLVTLHQGKVWMAQLQPKGLQVIIDIPTEKTA